ncbi:hypothetical protein [Clostridium tertium]|uniref:Uncharacterized protein n=1 Tax=Clostridium tertium TaxID=1559 RepID=A0A6N3AYF5_9CLOT
MKKLNNYIAFGLLINSFWLSSRYLFPLPEFINGFCVGLGTTLILWGAYIENHDISKIKDFKRKVLLRIKN